MELWLQPHRTETHSLHIKYEAGIINQVAFMLLQESCIHIQGQSRMPAHMQPVIPLHVDGILN